MWTNPKQTNYFMSIVKRNAKFLVSENLNRGTRGPSSYQFVFFEFFKTKFIIDRYVNARKE